jgi:hypothetical protein
MILETMMAILKILIIIKIKATSAKSNPTFWEAIRMEI